MGETYTYLYSEFIYLKYHINKIGEKPRYEQILSLQEDLEKVKQPKQTNQILISIFYLLLNHSVENYSIEPLKFIKFKLRLKHARSLCSPVVLNCLLNELRAIQSHGDENQDDDDEDGVNLKKDSKGEGYDIMKLKMREKILQDLAIVLFLSSSDFFEKRENQDIVEEFMDYSLDGIN